MHIHSTDKINQIKNLRKRGYTIGELVSILSVPKTTIWHHIKDIKIPKKYIKVLKSRQGGSKLRAAQNWSVAKTYAKNTIAKIDKRDKLLIAACLYWGEGTKREFNILNSDPALIKVFSECIKEIGVSKERLKITLRVYDDINKEKAVRYWSRLIGVPRSQISNVNILSGKKNGKLEYGMCRIRITKGADYFKKIQSIINIVKENINAPS